jgi:hypothetical protein
MAVAAGHPIMLATTGYGTFGFRISAFFRA